MATSPTVTKEKESKVIKKLYPNYKVIVLNDDFNTFKHVSECLMKYIPGMTSDRAWELTNQVHFEGTSDSLGWASRTSRIIPFTVKTGWFNYGSIRESLKSL